MQIGAITRRLLVGGAANGFGLLSQSALAGGDQALSRAWAEMLLENEKGAEFQVADLDSPLNRPGTWPRS